MRFQVCFESRKCPGYAQIYWKIVPSTRTGDGKSTVANVWAPRIYGTRISAVDAERSWWRESTSDRGWNNSDRYMHMQYMDMFMIIVWQSSQIWQITERSDRHTQLKTIPPRCYVVVIMMYICVSPQLGQRPKCPAVRDLCQRSPRCVRDTWSQRHGHHLHLVTTHDKFTYISRYSAKRHKKTLLGLSEQNFAPPNAWLFLLVVVCMP